MKQSLFFAINHLHFLILEKIKNVSETLSSLTSASVSMILKMIDKERMYHAENAVDQFDVITELQILYHINEVKNDAVKIGSWNDEHEGKLNFLGNILCNEHDWDVEQVERYLYEVIETGPAVNLEE